MQDTASAVTRRVARSMLNKVPAVELAVEPAG
jgi:hypothetical protein